MNDDQQTAQEEKLIIPEEVRNDFPDLVELIQGSQSMNSEEMQYWIDVLPIMTEDQIQNLRDILDNEKQEIDEANKEFEEGAEKDIKTAKNAFDAEKYRQKQQTIREMEKQHEIKEAGNEEDILKELEDL